MMEDAMGHAGMRDAPTGAGPRPVHKSGAPVQTDNLHVKADSMRAEMEALRVQGTDGALGVSPWAGVRARRETLEDLLSGTFNAILSIEEKSLDNRLTHGLTITEVHTIVAVGLHESNPMNVVAARLNVTLATLTTAVGKLVEKGFVKRTRAEDDRRKVLLSLTKRGRQVYRAHGLFHRQMIDEALSELTDEEERVFADALVKVKHFFDSRA